MERRERAFTPVLLPNQLRGLTGRHIEKLYTQVTTWGVSGKTFLGAYINRGEYLIYVPVAEHTTLIVIEWKCKDFLVVPLLQGGLAISASISTNMLSHLILGIDLDARARGGLKEGERVPLSDPPLCAHTNRLPIIPVEAFFYRKDRILLLDGSISPSRVLEQFDEQDQLDTDDMFGVGGGIVFHKSAAPLVAQRKMLMLRMFTYWHAFDSSWPRPPMIDVHVLELERELERELILMRN